MLAALLALTVGASPALAEIIFEIGEPLPDSTKSGIGQISGWAVSDIEIVSVEAFIDGISLGKVPYGGTRMDVAAAFPQHPNSEFSGWAMKWNYSLLDSGEHEVTIVVTDAQGAQQIKQVSFTTTSFKSEFISDPNEVQIAGATMTTHADGRIVMTGAVVEGETVDIEIQWDTGTQQFLISNISREVKQEENQSPSADAGPNLTIETGSPTEIQGSATDSDGTISSWSWSQISGLPVTLENAQTSRVSFTAPESEGTIQVRLTVTDDDGASDSDSVTITVEAPAPAPNQAPTANAGANQTVEQGDTVTLSGGGSDPDGEIVGWSWQQVSGPTVSIVNAGNRVASFTAPEVTGQIRLRLTVTDDDGATDTDDLTVTVEAPPPPPNQAPTANAGANQTVEQGDTVTLSGGGSDPDGSIVGWSWQRISGPAVSITNASSPVATFTAPNTAGEIRLRLTVTDDDGATDSDDMIVTVEEASEPDNTTGGTLQSMLPVINGARGVARTCGDDAFPAQPPLQWSASLADIAQQHSMDMAREGYFSHTSLNGTSMGDRVFPYWSGTRVGENIAASSGNLTDAQVVQLWLDSPGHCALIMDPDFTHAGIGTGQDMDNGYTYQYFWTLDFGG
jgi:uncharacterized protein YkwD